MDQFNNLCECIVRTFQQQMVSQPATLNKPQCPVQCSAVHNLHSVVDTRSFSLCPPLSLPLAAVAVMTTGECERHPISQQQPADSHNTRTRRPESDNKPRPNTHTHHSHHPPIPAPAQHTHTNTLSTHTTHSPHPLPSPSLCQLSPSACPVKPASTVRVSAALVC